MDFMQPTSTPPETHIQRRQAVRRHTQKRHHRFYAQRLDGNFIPNFSASPIHWSRERWVISALAATLILLALVVTRGWSGGISQSQAATTEWSPIQLPSASVALPTDIHDDHRLAFMQGIYVPLSEAEQWTAVTVESGQTLGTIFSGEGIPTAQMHHVLSKMPEPSALTRLAPGEHLGIRRDESGQLTGIQFDAVGEGRIQVELNKDGSVSEQKIAGTVEKRVRVASGVIEGSLFAAGDAAGLSDATILKMAKVFSYDIDFAQSLRKGDRFAVVYEDRYRNGEPISGGEILGAFFINRGKRYDALRFESPDGTVEYYDNNGRPLRKAFIRTPVEFTRISSRFTSSRRHPILGALRAHQGVDYAAPSGTPIIAAASGTFVSVGWKGGYGNTIVIDHGKGHTTLYGHMSRFAAGSKRGQRVSQGTVIGYVGKTGLATGPHLHYEFRIGGVHRDPLKLTLPPPEPLPKSLLASFNQRTLGLISQLASADARYAPLAMHQ